MEKLIDYLKNSFTSFHAVKNAKALLEENNFEKLSETEDWRINEGGKYYIVRGGALIAFTVGSLDNLSYKIAASHTDSPALKLKENPLQKSALYATLNAETYGGGIWYSFFDRPLKLAGRVIKQTENKLKEELVVSPFLLTIPSVAIHQNRSANDGFSVNAQVDLAPLLSLNNGVENMQTLLSDMTGEGVISYDLFLVNADMPYSFGANDEFLASPRIDNLSSVYASLEGLLQAKTSSGISLIACLDNEEVGSLTAQGADGDFLENVLRRIAYALRFDDNEYYKALASSFLLSVDNAHATHPNHPEKSDITNKVTLGGGVVIKSHANHAYITDAMSSAILQTMMERSGVKYQYFYNHSNALSGSTLGASTLRHVGVRGADIGIAQLAMHSACESFAIADFSQMQDAITVFYSSDLAYVADGILVR
jgi:aspartyl aminopeptidase